MSILYFAYGSCMDKERLMEAGVIEEFELIGIGRIDGWRFCMNKRSGCRRYVWANVEKDEKSYVYGVLYQVSDRGHKYLDHREQYPEHYEKEYVTVKIEEHLYENVMIYVATAEYKCQAGLPTTQKYEIELNRGGASLPEPYRTQSLLKEIQRCQSYKK
ncbi:gamma-glutamylcyclotransferase family protein [Heliorestis convoluta]|uniref:Gamma-glutamylcyclotransferase n=1 Tax=Heliorestis convoluta TaxID=356322 RepID=A0A5Q2MZE6_9FIRM|nr:gamma-glutamylcyclotransferase family protein [Heliorestis convoluta]QGG46813.1 gamma-glutamylcyclotransferase [Heliorestis convoluta]